MMTSIHPGDADWRPELEQAFPPPRRLFVRGRLPGALGIGVVGTRKMSPYGKACVDLLVPQIVSLGLPVISGLALGIDGAAHEAALAAHGTTFGFVGSGIDDESLYPRAHLGLAKRMIDSGGGVGSEYPPGTTSYPSHFPERNRLIAALSRAVLVVEAPKKSGAMITARLALEMGREVWAVPGSIHHPNSEGPHWLIKNGAVPICGPEDVAEALGMVPRQTKLPELEHYDGIERAALEKIASGAETADAIARALGLSVTAVTALLTTLEMKNAVRPVGGGRYTFYT